MVASFLRLALLLLLVRARGDGFQMTEEGQGSMLGEAPWIKPSEKDWDNPRNLQDSSAKCEAQCLSIAECYYITYITGGDRRGECWLAPKESGEHVAKTECGMPCESFKKTVNNKNDNSPNDAIDLHFKKDLQVDLAQKIRTHQAGTGTGDDDAAPQATWSLLIFQVQVKWKGGLSTFSASDEVLRLIREGVADTLGISKVHVAQMDITEWDDRFLIDYHVKVHKSEKTRVEHELGSPRIGEKVFNSLRQNDPQAVKGLNFAVVDALSKLTISSVKQGGAIAEPNGSIDMRLILSVFAVVSFFAVIASSLQSGEKGTQELAVGIEKRNRSFAEQEMTPIGF
jgi:hypothetical protein